jgi:predicted nuclease with TOPRIM domain
MRTKTVVYFLSFLLVSSAVVYCVGAAQTKTQSFHGVGVKIELAFPDEAHPTDTISHNITITAIVDVALQNITLFIYAPINSTLQHVKNQTITWPLLLAGNSLPTSEIRFTLPQNANGTLYCLLYVQTDQSADYASYTFYTTQVRTLTYTELLSAHNQLIANYSALSAAYDQLNANYSALLIAHNNLLVNYSTLFADYGTLLGSYNTLLAQYGALSTAYNGLTSDYATLNSTYNLLSANYDALNSTFNSLLAKNNALQSDYNSLNSTHYNLQASYNSLEGNYNSIVAKDNALQSDYNSLSSTDSALQTNYNTLNSTKNTLQSDYNSLNSTHYSVQASYDLLRGAYDTLNRTYTSLASEFSDLNQRVHNSENAMNSDRIVLSIFTITVACLVGFIIYIKRKKPEPYVVIRKETVTVKPEESPPT